MITELVINHTSDQHPGPGCTSRAPRFAEREFNVWSDATRNSPARASLHRYRIIHWAGTKSQASTTGIVSSRISPI